MKLFGLNITRERRSSPEDPRTSLANPAAWLTDLMGAASAAGINVTAESAMKVPAVAAAINGFGQTVASLPLHVFAKGKAGDEPAMDHPLYPLLHSRPNEIGHTSYRWRMIACRHLYTKGRHVSRIVRGRGDKVQGIIPLPTSVQVERVAGRLSYVVPLNNGGRERLSSDEVLHFTGMEDEDGIDCVSPIDKGRDAIGLALALQLYGSSFFKNGARVGLFIETPKGLSSAAQGRLKASIEKTHGSPGEGFNAMLLEQGVKVHKATYGPDESQFIEARRFQIQEIARLFRFPPTLLQDLSDGTYTNSEQQDLFFEKHTIRPPVVMMEQEMESKLLTAEERETMSIRFNMDGLLRGDFSSRMNGLAQAIQNSILTPNEGRELENKPKLPGGDRLLIQGATVPLVDAGNGEGAENDNDKDD